MFYSVKKKNRKKNNRFTHFPGKLDWNLAPRLGKISVKVKNQNPCDQFKRGKQDKTMAWIKQLEFFPVFDILVEVDAGHTHPCKAEAI